MLSLLFAICIIWFIGKFFIFGVKASWGILKLLCTVVFFPVILIGMVVGYVLGRLFAYAPKTADGHYPCEAVCQIIEEYGDESLLSEYRCELFNKRGIFSPSAGRAEKDIAEGYKDNADFLSIKYPKTADVFFKMSQRYVYDSDLERRRAENGYF